MNDFDVEPDAATRGPNADAVDYGLLPRDHAERGATFTRRPDEQAEPTRMYRAVTVRVRDSPTTLLVGPRCDVSAARTYRIDAVRAVSAGRLATVRFRSAGGDRQ